MKLEELERNLFARYGGTSTTGKTVTSGNVVAKVAGIAVAKPANEHMKYLSCERQEKTR